MKPFRPMRNSGAHHYADIEETTTLYPDTDGVYRSWRDLSRHALADLLGLRAASPTRWWNT